MKEIKAFIKPSKVSQIVEALNKNGYESVTLSLAEGTGSFKRKDPENPMRFSVSDSNVVKLELVCKNADVDMAIRIISENGRTDERRDGIIYVSSVEKAYRVKTGQAIL